MSYVKQLWQFALVRVRVSRQLDRERGEVSATTIIWAAALIAVAVAVSALLVGKINNKAKGINF
jgi:hypothetical protein